MRKSYNCSVVCLITRQDWVLQDHKILSVLPQTFVGLELISFDCLLAFLSLHQGNLITWPIALWLEMIFSWFWLLNKLEKLFCLQWYFTEMPDIFGSASEKGGDWEEDEWCWNRPRSTSTPKRKNMNKVNLKSD